MSQRNIVKSTTDVPQVRRWIVETCMHRPIDIGAALADDQTYYFIIGRQDKLSFGAKTTVQCSDQLKHKITVKLAKSSTGEQSLVVETKKSQFHRPIMVILAPAHQKGPHGRPKWPINQ